MENLSQKRLPNSWKQGDERLPYEALGIAYTIEDAYDNAPEFCAGAPGLPEGCQLVGLLFGLPRSGLVNGLGLFRKGGTVGARHL